MSSRIPWKGRACNAFPFTEVDGMFHDLSTPIGLSVIEALKESRVCSSVTLFEKAYTYVKVDNTKIKRWMNWRKLKLIVVQKI